MLRIDRYETGGRHEYAICGELWLERMGDGRLVAEDGTTYYESPCEASYPDETGAWGYALTDEENEAAVSEGA